MNTYEFVDYNQYAGTTYFRLTQVDFDGILTYSEIIALENCNSDLDDISVFDNGMNEININIRAENIGQYNVKIIDSRGRLITNPKQLVVKTGFNNFTLPIQDLSYGVYYVIIGNETERIAKKLLLN
jgi:hypothetical protein